MIHLSFRRGSQNLKFNLTAIDRFGSISAVHWTAAACRTQTFKLLFRTFLMLPKRTKSLLAAQLGRFVQQYGRKAAKGWDPNDRSYNRKLEEKMKRLSPEDLSDLLSGEDVEPVQPHSKPTKEADN